MWSKPAVECPTAVVGLLGPAGEFIGTGFFISPRLIMTCEHVVLGVSTIAARRLVGGGTLTFRLLNTDPDRDLAVLQLEGGDDEQDPIPPLIGLSPELLRTLDGRLATIGVEASTGKPLRLDNLALRLVVGSLGAENDVREAQIDGGAPRGMSGSPVFAGAPDVSRACVGMMVLGGSHSGQSLLRGPDAMIPLWEETGVRDEIAARPARELLRAPSESPSSGADSAFIDLLLKRSRTRRVRAWKMIALRTLLACAVAGLTFAALRAIGRPTGPPAWLVTELFPGVSELLRNADDLHQFSRNYLLAAPKSYPGFRQQVVDLNNQIRAFNCTSEHLLAGKNLFRDKLSVLQPEKLKDLVVRVSEARFPAKYPIVVSDAPVIGPLLPRELSVDQKLSKQYQDLVVLWSEYATHLDGPLRETRDYLVDLEKEVLHSLELPIPECGL